MAFFVLRFDFRNPAMAGTTMAERYRAGLDMAEWADRLGFVSLTLSEHHGSEDGYLPSPLTMAAAIAGRTTNIRILVAAAVASFYEPLRLAEEAAVVDHLSGGRLDLVVGAGYLPSEFEMFGVPVTERVRRTVEMVETLRAAWTGEPFAYRGRKVRVTPAPLTVGGPPLQLGASSEAAARRAARMGIGLMAPDAVTWEFFRDETMRLGRPDPGPYFGGDTRFVHLAEDVEAGWAAIAPHAMHDASTYGRWIAAGGPGAATSAYQPVSSAEELRTSGRYRVLTPEQYLAELRDARPFAIGQLHPLMGGIPPEVAWQSLRLLEQRVLPNL
jgi:alkanesulfonate monooxygenase SsuD/methylene tetrahydromethanopterin reductase-like flavin-dependent oxidoreductase (luciferase family)